MKKIILGFRCAVFGLALALSWPAEATNYFSGLLHAPLGVATLYDDGSALTVGNITSSGNDGVRVFTGGGGGATTKLGLFNPDVLPIDAFLRWAAIDPTDLKLQELMVRRTATGGALYADFTGLGAPTVSVALYSNNVLLASASGIPPTASLLTFGGGGPAGGGGGGLPLALNPCILHPEDCYGVIDVDIWQPDPIGPIGTIVTLPGNAPTRGTRVTIQPDPLPVAPATIHVKEIQITGKSLGTMKIGTRFSVGVNFGANEPPPGGSALAPSDVAGAVPQPNWNNAIGPIGSVSALVGDLNGVAVPTTITVEWASPNTWSSTGHGEENNGFLPGGDRLLMSGYLDTDNGPGVARVAVFGIDPLTANVGYDVIVYILGGVGGRGGAYTIGGVTKYGTAATNPPAHIEDPGIGLADTGTFVRFRGLTGSSFTLVADANNANGPERNFRAPINGIQIIRKSESTPEGLVYFGLEHDAVGQAQYTFDAPNSFTVGDLGVSGNDGVDVRLQRLIQPSAAGSPIIALGPSRNAYSGDWVMLNPQPFPPGGGDELSIRAVGDWNGLPGFSIGSLHLQRLGTAGKQLVPDFSPVGASRVRVELWSGCTRISSFTSPNGVSLLTMTDAIAGTSISADPGDEPCGTVPLPLPPPWWWSVKWSGMVGVSTPSGGQFQIDRVRVAPDDVTGTLASFSEVSYRVAGYSGLQFTGESAGQPMIQCPTNIVVPLPCFTNCVPVNFPLPTVSNGTLANCTPPSGTCLPAGTHGIVCVAINPAARAECTFTVQVVLQPIQFPVLQCPTNTIVVMLPCLSNCVPVSYPAPTVSNGTLISCLPPSGTCLPAGTHTILCRASNVCSEILCLFNVDVVPEPIQPPVLQCPTNPIVVTLPCFSNCVPVSYSAPTVLNGTLIGCIPPSGTCLPAGTHTILCRASNPCSEAECVFTVRVNPFPIQHPVLLCPTNPIVATLPCLSNCVPVIYSPPTVLNGTLISCTPPSGTCLPAGIQTILCRATNTCTETVCDFVVSVEPEQIEPPVILCPQDIIATTCGVGEVVTYPDPIVIGASPGDYTLTCTPPSGSFFPVGTNKVVCCVVNRCSQTNCCAFNVIVPNGITFAGNQHCPLGVATLTKDAASGTLVLGNITETGLDGVQIALRGADFCEVISPFMAMPGDSCRYDYRATVDGIDDRTAAVLTVGGNAAGEMLFTGDMSGLGATRYTVLVLDGETQIARVSDQPVANVSVGGNALYVAPSLRWDIKTYKCYIRIKLPKLPGNPGPLIRLAGGLAVSGDNVIILPEDPTRKLGTQNRVLLTATAIHPEPKLFLSEQLGLFGIGHTGLGDATLAANGDALTVGNLGVSGNDGVAIDLNASGNFLASFLPLDGSVVQGPVPYPSIQARAFGHFGAALNHDLGSLRFTGLSPTAVEVLADFSPVGVSTHTIEVWQNGQLVQRITGHAGTVGTLNAWPSGIGTQGNAGPDPVSYFWATFTGGVRVSITGGPTLDGDELRVLVENPSAPIGALQSLHLQASSFESFTIVNEHATPALTPRLGNIGRAPGGGLQLTIPTAFGYKYTVESVSALGPQPVQWSPIKTFAGDGSLNVVPLTSPDPVQQFYRLSADNPFGPAGGNPIPDMIFPHKVFLFLDNVIVDEARDPQKGDRPYFVTILFQTVLNKSNSTIVEVREGEPHDWVSKDEYNGAGTLLKGKDHMLPQDMLPLPVWMGHFEWDDIQWKTPLDLKDEFLSDPINFKPQIMLLGAAVLALQNNNTPPDRIRNVLNQLANGLKQQLIAQVESGNILDTSLLSLLDPKLPQKLQDRFQQMAGDILKSSNLNFWDIVDLLIGSLGDPDVPIGANILLMPAIPGIQPTTVSTNVPLLSSSVSVSGLMRPPDNFSSVLAFRGMNAAYRVNARVVPDFVPPPPPTNQPDPTLMNVVTVFTKTGGDDLRGSSAAMAEIRIKNRSPETFRLNDPNQGFDKSSQHTKNLLLSSPAPYLDIESITLHVVQGSCFGCTSDNWDVEFLGVSCSGIPGTKPLFSKGGTPLVRLVEKDEHPQNNEFISRTFLFTH